MNASSFTQTTISFTMPNLPATANGVGIYTPKIYMANVGFANIGNL